MEEIKNAVTPTIEETLKAKYNKVYRISASIEIDDDTTEDKEYYFKRPSAGSYDRYVKTTANGATKALKAFLNDSVTDESRAKLEDDLEEYPALTLSLGEKLLGLMGLSKNTNLQRL